MALKKKKTKKSTKKKSVSKRPSPKKKTPKKKKMPSGVRAKMKKGLMKRLKEDQERRKAGGRGIFKPDVGVDFWSPEGGDHLIDIIPFIAGSKHPTVPEGEPAYTLRVKVHYGVGPNEDKSFVCLYETYGQDCPICEHRAALRTDGADEDVWKALYPKKRAIYNIVSFDSSREEEKGVQIWEVAEFYFQKHLDTLAKGSRRPGQDEGALVAFTDPDEGKSIAFTINPPKSRNDFAEYIGHRFEERDYELEDDILEDAQPLDELINIPEYNTVYEEYYGESIDEDSDDDDDDEEVEDDDVEDDDDEDDEDSDDEDEDEDEDDDEDEDEDELTCRGGGEFGVDTNELEYCDEDCEVWEECLAEQQRRKKAKRAKASKGKKKKLKGKKKKKK